MSTPGKKDALGKGIRSLLQSIDEDLKTTAGQLKPTVTEAVTGIIRIPISDIDINPKQPRRDFDEQALKELADKIDRSVGFLSQVERGLSRPTVADLTAISHALDVPTTYFYSLSKPKAVSWVTRPNERRTVYYANGITDILVSPKMRASFSMLESLLEPGASSGERHMNDSSEQGGYVLEGQLTLWLDDAEPVTLEAGDSFQLASHAHCRYGNRSDQLTRVLWVYT